MEQSITVRRNDGESVANEYYEEIDSALKNLLASIEGFRRDADLAKNSDSPIKIHIDTKRIFIPPAKNDTGLFSGISDTLVRMIKAFDGSIELGLGWQKSEQLRQKAWRELYVIHENMVFIGAAGRILHNTLLDTSRIFHEFNGYNDEAHLKANIPFDDDALNICIVTTRAIIEHAVRLDIDIMSDIEKIRTDDAKAFV